MWLLQQLHSLTGGSGQEGTARGEGEDIELQAGCPKGRAEEQAVCFPTDNSTISVPEPYSLAEHPLLLLGGQQCWGHHHPLCPRTLPWVSFPRQRLALGQVWGWHWVQLSCPSSHMPLSGLNFPLMASALFSAHLGKTPLELLFLPLFPNLDSPKAAQAEKSKFIASLCLWHCWNTLLPQILHQGSVGKAQCPQHGLTLTYICPSLCPPLAPCCPPCCVLSGLHRGASSCGSPCVSPGDSRCPRLLL